MGGILVWGGVHCHNKAETRHKSAAAFRIVYRVQDRCLNRLVQSADRGYVPQTVVNSKVSSISGNTPANTWQAGIAGWLRILVIGGGGFRLCERLFLRVKSICYNRGPGIKSEDLLVAI